MDESVQNVFLKIIQYIPAHAIYFWNPYTSIEYLGPMLKGKERIGTPKRIKLLQTFNIIINYK